MRIGVRLAVILYMWIIAAIVGGATVGGLLFWSLVIYIGGALFKVFIINAMYRTAVRNIKWN